MKKGLLGLLVIALTVVGCQNYDDQFDDLNRKIALLSADVSDLAGVSASVTALSDRVIELQNSSASASELAEVMAEVSGLQTALSELAALNYGTEEVDNLEAEVDEIKASINELLAQASIIQQDIVITSPAQLEYVENLMGLDAADDNTFVAEQSREYIVSGNITVDAQFVDTAAMGTRLNDVLARIASVITPDGGTGVTLDSGSAAASGSALTMTSMAFVQGQLSIEGANAIDVSNLAALTATLTLKKGGDLVFNSLNQVGDVVISTSDSITTLDFSNVASSNGQITTDTDQLVAPSLTGVVNIGAVGLPATVTIDNVSQLTAGAIVDGVTLSATDATAVTLNGTSAFTADGNIDITAKGDVTINVAVASGTLDITSTEGGIHLHDLTEIKGAATLTSSLSVMLIKLESNANGITATGSAFEVPELASNAGTLSVTADSYIFDELASNDGGIVLNGADEVTMPSLETSSATIVANDVATFMAIALETSTGTIDVKAGATIGVGDLADPTDLVDFANLLELQLHAQKTSVDFSTAVSMTTLTVLGKKNTPIVQTGQTNDVSITNANAALTDLTVGGVLRLVSLDDTELESFESVVGSTILVTQLMNNEELETITLAHDRLDGESALEITVVNNDKVQELDMSSVNKVKTITITGNASLTDITMAGFSPAVEPTANIGVTITANNLPGEYTSATAGTDTTPYLEAAILDLTENGILCAVKDFVDYYADAATTGTVTSVVDLDDVELYTQEEDANDVVVRTIADPEVNASLSTHIGNDLNQTGFGGGTNAIDSPADYALITCD